MGEPSCGLEAILVFLFALLAGTGCSLTSKVLLSMKSVGMTGELEDFSFPLFQTFGMFLGMTAALLMHFIVMRFKIPFPGYNFYEDSEDQLLTTKSITKSTKKSNHAPLWMYFLLIIPAMFDLTATALCMYGLRYVNVSMFQMLRGSAIVFVAILKHFALGDKLMKFQWVGVFWNVIAIVLVGLTALLSGGNNSSSEGGPVVPGKYDDPVIGVFLILCGAVVQSLQYAFEEKVMSMEVPASPLLLIGMEGFWGTLVCVVILYPLAYLFKGSDHGSIENYYNTYVMIKNSPQIQAMFVLYFISVFLYNMLACLVTFLLNSVWHAILDNFRPISVWTSDLFIYYAITRAFGEAWSPYSYIQLLGLFVLIYGTAIYNAPNSGSIKLTGNLISLGLDYRDEYNKVSDETAVKNDFKAMTPLIRKASNAGMTPNFGQTSSIPLTNYPKEKDSLLLSASYGATGSLSKISTSIQQQRYNNV